MSADIFELLQKELPGVQKSTLLSAHTTFKIGGPAEYFFVAHEQEKILKAITLAKELQIPLFIFGGGSNLLVSNKGLKGLVVKINQEVKDFVIEGNTITASAGVELQSLVDFSTSHSLKGLEWAGGLPGTLGGAVRGNAGAFGGEIKDVVKEVQAIDGTFQLRTFSNHECDFSYRSSIFKKNNWIIIQITLQFQEGVTEELEKIANDRRQYRKDKHPLEYPSAGSIFKNVGFETLPREFQNEFADKVKQDPFPIVPSAWFIIGAGLVGKTIGKAQISEKHSNYIVNLGGATASDVLALIKFAKEAVKEKYEVDLEVEVQYVE